jgi:hypothetical protein
MQVHSLADFRRRRAEEKKRVDEKIDDIIRLLALGYQNTDQKLEKIEKICKGSKEE